MWSIKKFKTEAKARVWMEKNDHKYQMQLCFINNGCIVEYRKLRKVY